MKKYLLGLALIAMSGLGSAQSSVTIFGGVDNAIGRGTGSVANRTRLVNNGNCGPKLGLRGTEDLGGGQSANFWLEGALSTDDGQGVPSNSSNQSSGTSTAPNGTQGLVFNRRSTVGLVGPWGELNAGRDHSAQYKGRFEVDPFGNCGVGTVQTQAGALSGPTGVRVSNFIGYGLPANLGGFYGFAQYYVGENASNAGATARDGTGAAARLGYVMGPLDVQVATARTHYAQTATAGSIRSSNATVRYQLGAVKLMSGYFIDTVDASSRITGKGGVVSAIWQVGAGDVKAALSRYKSDAGTSPATTKLSLGYVHNLSKRTALYATYARVSNSGGATAALNASITGPNQSSSGFDLGVRHLF